MFFCFRSYRFGQRLQYQIKILLTIWHEMKSWNCILPVPAMAILTRVPFRFQSGRWYNPHQPARISRTSALVNINAAFLTLVNFWLTLCESLLFSSSISCLTCDQCILKHARLTIAVIFWFMLHNRKRFHFFLQNAHLPYFPE